MGVAREKRWPGRFYAVSVDHEHGLWADAPMQEKGEGGSIDHVQEVLQGRACGQVLEDKHDERRRGHEHLGHERREEKKCRVSALSLPREG